MTLSARLLAVVEALPLSPGMRVIEVGGAPGAAAREVARRIGPAGHVLVVDRSAKGIQQVRRNCAAELASGVIGVRCTPVETVRLQPGEAPYELAFACRVGVLDGRHPEQRARAAAALRAMLRPGAPILIDTGDPLAELI